MPPFLRKLLGIPNAPSKVISQIKDIAKLSDDINKKTKELSEKEYNFLLEHKEEVFISLDQFLELMDKKDLDIKDILLSCKHVSDIDSSKFSYIDVYPIIEDTKIILSTEQVDSYKGDKIRIVTARIKK